MPLRVTSLRALRAFVPYVPSRFTCLTHAPYLRALCTLTACVKIFLGWICSPAKLSILQGLLKALQTVLVLYVGQRTALQLIKREKFFSIIKT